MTDQVVPEFWHIPRALSNEALRLLTSLPLDEIERRLRMDGPAVPEGREPAAVEGQLSDGEVAKLVAPIPTPIPVSERLPGPEDCLPWPDEPSANPWCWLGSNVDGDWGWEQRSAKSLSYHNEFTHWLPAHALPLPEVNHD